MLASLPRRRDTRGTGSHPGPSLRSIQGLGFLLVWTEERVHSMDSRRRPEDPSATDAALDFVRFCHRRRRVGWPELYDEMCHVASRGLYHGWGFGELAEHGIAFGLAEMPHLAGLVTEVVTGDAVRRPRLLVGVMAPEVRSEVLEEAPDDPGRTGAFIGAAR